MGKAAPYSGRLAFDPETGFHTDLEGTPVVTPDDGKSWFYAGPDDTSHFARYHQAYAEVDMTANAADPEPHHFEVQPDDPHFGGVKADPDVIAETITSHTDAAATS